MFSRLVKQLFEKRGRNGSPQSGKSNAVGAEDEQILIVIGIVIAYASYRNKKEIE